MYASIYVPVDTTGIEQDTVAGFSRYGDWFLQDRSRVHCLTVCSYTVSVVMSHDSVSKECTGFIYAYILECNNILSLYLV